MQNGGYRLSSGTQRRLRRVTGARWRNTPDRRLFAPRFGPYVTVLIHSYHSFWELGDVEYALTKDEWDQQNRMTAG